MKLIHIPGGVSLVDTADWSCTGDIVATMGWSGGFGASIVEMAMFDERKGVDVPGGNVRR